MAKTAAEWAARPKFPTSHYVDARIYSDPTIFAEEKEKLFKKCWIIGCHESEIPNAYDYRLFSHPAGMPLIVVRGDDMKVRDASTTSARTAATRSSTTPRATRSG